MSNIQSNSNVQATKLKFDLEERTALFSEQVLNFVSGLSQTLITKPLISQIVRSATSISANYCEADEANSKKDFINKIVIAKKETKETKHWLRLIAYALPESKTVARKLWQEAHELNLIFAAIVRNSKEKSQ